MNTFANAVQNTETFSTTENGALTLESSTNELVDLFFKIGAWRTTGPDYALVQRALIQDRDIASRIIAWGRDIRGGAGERKTFREILNFVSKMDIEMFESLVYLIPELGRWDDLLAITDTTLRKEYAYPLIEKALQDGNGLCAKWMPRKGPIAIELRNSMGMSPKQYRKTLVGLSNTVEQKMCAGEWEDIEFSHVPSVAFARYKNTFWRRTPQKFTDFVAAVETGEKEIHAGAVFPHDVIRSSFASLKSAFFPWRFTESKFDMDSVSSRAAIAQWESLPNFIDQENTRILPMIDLSGSMEVEISGSMTAMCAAVALGVYVSEKQTGEFKDMFCTFTAQPRLMKLGGSNVLEKIAQMIGDESAVGYDTNIQAAFDRILDVAIRGDVPQEEMPTHFMILSDMEFNAVEYNDKTNFEEVKAKFSAAGYEMPQMIFWNLNAHSKANVPVKAHESGSALISGFSPAIVKSVLSAEALSPVGIMLATVMQDRYKVL